VTTNSLAKHYHILSSAERFSLMFAAAVRGDELEHSRLVDAAPREQWRVPHTFGRALAFFAVFTHHRMEQLELAALFFKTAALAEGATEKLAVRLENATRLYGYLVNIHGKAWVRFCELEGLDPTVCETVAPGGMTIEWAEGEAAAIAFTEDEAREYAEHRDQDSPARLKTVESVVEELRTAYTMLLAKWE
jgi:hypothetical protein